mmetsp:Transcript_29504/g.70913  ORF Transcript_29504/g.70913 Transcript_29504/m.70913 type:complete len:98 (-) Transcript_29504:132-425(-)
MSHFFLSSWKISDSLKQSEVEVWEPFLMNGSHLNSVPPICESDLIVGGKSRHNLDNLGLSIYTLTVNKSSCFESSGRVGKVLGKNKCFQSGENFGCF